MEKAIRVLHVIAGLGSGGAEMILMNMYRNIDRTKVQFDFLLRSDENLYADEIQKLGGRVFYSASFPRHFIKNRSDVRDFLAREHFDAVHVHANALLYITALQEAKHAKIKKRIIHSHSSFLPSPVPRLLHYLARRHISSLATDCLACSVKAGDWMFPGDYTVLNNAIDLQRFRFDSGKREKIRSELGITGDAFVIGHVGRFFEVKNHDFLVDVFLEVLKKRENSYLVLLGEGGLQEKIRAKVDECGIHEKVRFVGVKSNVGEYLSAMDAFVFPSLFEGLPLTLIEAQTNGLPIVCSDVITNEVAVSEQIHMLPLSLGAVAWAEKIMSMDLERKDVTQDLIRSGFDITEEAKKLESIYLGM